MVKHMKQCCACHQYLLIENFHKNISKKDGLCPRCKTCRSKQANNKIKRRADRRYKSSSQGRASQKRYIHSEKGRRAYFRYPERRAARTAVARAVRDGMLLHPTALPCSMASEQCHGRHEYHHYLGYEREHWLDVKAICAVHHRLADKNQLDASMPPSANPLSIR